jgi:hypothetical protein
MMSIQQRLELFLSQNIASNAGIVGFDYGDKFPGAVER